MPLTLIVGVTLTVTAEVNGTPPAVLVAPLKAGSCVEAVGFGVAVELAGFNTLHIKTRISKQHHHNNTEK